ncbi:hypothetical protein PQE66_gp051 [Bacillus phage PBC2]|uniref:Uncharacterized protein n=1 Tax=Bacillus phage PBC2 TaxID=1675029 RepID=A0A218KBV4_9CAUD|nr:hypothetical protein PQE66_gp051 [Bacillus phage PBC2]AKQ08366.1 hypothetical protein PBC2_051 [Bacillus phage PBC2]
MARKKKNKKKTIGVMTQNRGVQAPPTVADENKKKKNNRKRVKEDIRKGKYDD